MSSQPLLSALQLWLVRKRIGFGFNVTQQLTGAVVGQLLFGALADKLGRRVIFICTITGVVLGSLLSATCVESEYVGIYTQLIIYQLLLGFGIGGEYPLSATIASESSETADRGKNVCHFAFLSVICF